MTASAKETSRLLSLNRHQSEFQILAYVAVAVLPGAIIGLEREVKDSRPDRAHTCSLRALPRCL